MAQQYKKEAKEPGKHAKNEDQKAVLRYRLRLKDLQYKFGVAQGFPQRYLKILANPDSHSDEEFDPISNKYFIKKLECRSDKENTLIQRVDEEMSKAENADGKKAQRRDRHIPPKGKASISKTVPKGLPINFYDPEWFNNLPAGQKRTIANCHVIKFLPDASKSLLGTHHSEERLSNKRFTKLNWEEAIKPYNISHEISNNDDLDDSLNKESDDLENLEEEIEEEDHIHEMNNNEPGEFNHLLDRDIKMEDAGDQNENQNHFNVLNF
ncbi:hypothetical protein O181_059330 [Austropuccinia psidii MF-1]|uniref:Uncharacterized protein n=1 Tax=Austropuccinia psidii MF-1 TaxID=1389203 RepID=A0A9Q3EB94_9BASI|nr:hypothetical protein [Austropuccinia psidii MF-1]